MFANPLSFRYGAHDFFDLTGGDSQEITLVAPQGADDIVAASALRHEAVVVDGENITFYRNGRIKGTPIALPRVLTDCADGQIEMGFKGLGITALKFYGKALETYEIHEMVESGQTLGELGTSSKLPELDVEVIDKVTQMVNAKGEEVLKSIRAESLAAESAWAKAEGGEGPGGNDVESVAIEGVLIPEDVSPPAALVQGSGQANLLPAYEKDRWERGGSKTDISLLNRWEEDSLGIGTFWWIFEDPVYVPNTGVIHFANLPRFQSDLEAVTVTFWARALLPRHALWVPGSGSIVFSDDGNTPLHPSVFQHLLRVSNRALYFWDTSGMVSGVGAKRDSTWLHSCSIGGYRQSDGSVSEEFMGSNYFQRDTMPIGWRMISFSLDHRNSRFQIFLDGKLLHDSRFPRVCEYDQTVHGGTDTTMPGSFPGFDQNIFRQITDTSLSDLLNGLNVSLGPGHNSWPFYSSSDPILTKYADLRVYTRALGERELLLLREHSSWPDAGARMQQCVDTETEMNFADSTLRDEQGRSCQWYQQHKTEFPRICNSQIAKQRCPVACSGFRRCYDGSLSHGHQKYSPKTAHIFNRIMHLKPKNGIVVCPSDRKSRAQLLQDCKNSDAKADQTWLYDGNLEWTPWIPSIKDCKVLGDVLGDSECGWSAEGMSEVMDDYRANGTLSLSWWAKSPPTSSSSSTDFAAEESNDSFLHSRPPKAGGVAFLPSFKFLSQIVHPIPFIHSAFTFQRAQDMQLFSVFLKTNSAWGWFVAFGVIMQFQCCVNLGKDWTFWFMQVQRMPGGGSQVCGTFNNIPLNSGICQPFEAAVDVEDILNAVEVDTEMLISPIRVSTSLLTASQIQLLYYESLPKLERITGPGLSESQRVELTRERDVRTPHAFSEHLVLMSPPLIFQSRVVSIECKRPASQRLLNMHRGLVTATHCLEGNVSCLGLHRADAVFACRGLPDHGPHFGQNATTFLDKTGVADFLYSLDSEMIVRNGEVKDTREFLDAMSSSAFILAILQSPENGQIHYLQLEMDLSGIGVETTVTLSHLGFLDSTGRRQYWYSFVPCLVCVCLVLLLNIRLLSTTCRGSVWQTRNKWKVVESIFDIFHVAALLPFCFTSLIASERSEQRAESLVDEFASIPWVESGLPFHAKQEKFFRAIRTLDRHLATDGESQAFGFVILLLLLLRIIAGTSFHPRVGLLTGTVMHGLNDFWHFALLFGLVFFFFASTASWVFSSSNSDFSDLQTSMSTQFLMLMGNLPEGFDQDWFTIAYVILTNVVMFFLCFNFLLAIVVEAYTRVRDGIEENEVEGEVFVDLLLTCARQVQGFVRGWPDSDKLLHLLETQVASKSISVEHLRLAGVEVSVAHDLVRWFRGIHSLRAKDEIDCVYFEGIQSFQRSSSLNSVGETGGTMLSIPSCRNFW